MLGGGFTLGQEVESLARLGTGGGVMAKQRVYEGQVYIRPVERGMVLSDLAEGTYIEQWVEDVIRESQPNMTAYGSGWAGKLRITVELLDGD